MSNFLKLKSLVLNTNYINRIIINQNKFTIHLLSNEITGYILIGSGGINSVNEEIRICKIKDPDDYKTVENWINQY